MAAPHLCPTPVTYAVYPCIATVTQGYTAGIERVTMGKRCVVSLELRNVSLQLRNVCVELRNVSLELRNGSLQLRNGVYGVYRRGGKHN
jgi:hypothetical protein